MIRNLVNTNELAKRLGMSVATINYYTNLGLFHARERKGNIRLYDKDEIARTFEVIQRLRKEGYSLRLITQKLEKGYNI